MASDIQVAPWEWIGSVGYGAFHAMRKTAITLLFIPTLAWGEPVVIAALGDSLTQGYGLPEADGLVPNLQTWIDGQVVEATILNAGVSGDTTAGGLARTEWTLTEDVDAIIVALGGNDVLRALDPAMTKQNLRGILEITKDRGVPVMLVGMQAPGNYGPDYKANFDALFPDLAQEYGTLFHIGYLEALRDTPDLSTVLQRDFIHPNAVGVDMIVKDIGPTVLELISVAQQ
jgi:acyl-CoA thioesterase-1